MGFSTEEPITFVDKTLNAECGKPVLKPGECTDRRTSEYLQPAGSLTVTVEQPCQKSLQITSSRTSGTSSRTPG